MLEICLWTIRSAWGKTTLITGGVGGEGEDRPTCKMGTFFIMYLDLSVSIFKIFQENGALGESKNWKFLFGCFSRNC